MGQLHFEQMQKVAIEVDCVSLPIAHAMGTPNSKVDAKLFGVGFWAHRSLEERVVLARKIGLLRDWFSHELKGMLLEGSVEVMCVNPRTGKPMKIKDPNVIDFDDPVLRPEDFREALSQVK